MRFLYEVIFYILAFLYAPIFFMKGKHKGEFMSRLGVLPLAQAERMRGQKILWIHAVSVGEVALAFRLANLIRTEIPSVQFCFTTTTMAGRDVAARLKKDEDHLFFFPMDFGFAVRSFIEKASPKAVVIMETEIWPNLIWELSNQKIPFFIMNGRISDKAIVKYKKIEFFIKPILKLFTGIAAQDELMRSRFLELGACPEMVVVTGNMKYDWKPTRVEKDYFEMIQRVLKPRQDELLCIAGSTHEGEEVELLKIYKSILKKRSDFRLVIAPRHLDRIQKIEKSAQTLGLKLIRLSAISEPGFMKGFEFNYPGVFLLDRMGVLGNLYELADIVFIGGSLVPKGGHNLVEPAYFGKAILFGPYFGNFKFISEEFKKNNAAIQVADALGLQKEIVSIMDDYAKRCKMGQAARSLVSYHQGAAQRNVDFMMKSIEFLRS